MGLLERIDAHRNPRNFQVGPGVVDRYDAQRGHDDSLFSPESYGDYIATSSLIFSLCDLRARLLAKLPVRLYDDDSPTKKEITAGSEYDLLRYVNPFWTPYRLKKMTQMCRDLWGEAYWAVERDQRGVPQEIWWVKPTQMRPVPHPDKYLAGFIFTPPNGGQEIPFRTDEIVWFRNPNPLDEFSALSPLAAARLAADTQSAMMKANKKIFDNGYNVGGAVVPPQGVTYSEDDAKRLEQALDDRFRGVDKSHRWAVLRFQAQFDTMGLSPKDVEWANGLNITLRDACNAYGVPAPLMNDLEHATLANATVYDRLLWENALVPEGAFFAEELREQLIPMFRRSPVGHIAHDYSQVAALQEALNAQWDRERGQIEAGGLLINEWRASRGLPPVPWGDKWWAQVNRAPIATETDTTVPAKDASAAQALADIVLPYLEVPALTAAFNLDGQH